MIDVLSEFNKWKETYTEINKSIDPLEELYLNDIISEDIFEKARSGTYSDTPQNKKLGRVGQKYGSKKGEEEKSSESETIDSLKEEYKTALDGNDFDKLAEIHKKLVDRSREANKQAISGNKPEEETKDSSQTEKELNKKNDTVNDFKSDVDLKDKFVSEMYFEKYNKELKTEQIQAIQGYQENGESINTGLRKGKGGENKELDKLFGQFKLDHNLELNRLIVASNDSLKKIMNGLSVGSELSDNGYLSTTTTEDVLDKFKHPKDELNFNLKIRVKKGQTFIPVKNYSQIDYKDENEMLFPRGAKIKIVSKEGNNIVGELSYE